MAAKICKAKVDVIDGTQIYSHEDGYAIHGSAVIAPDVGGVLWYWDEDPAPAIPKAPLT